jgi:hypothetical protein
VPKGMGGIRRHIRGVKDGFVGGRR